MFYRYRGKIIQGLQPDQLKIGICYNIFRNNWRFFLFHINFSRLSDMTRISREKEDLVRRLRFLMDVERDGLEVELARRIEELEEMKKRHREEETKIQLEITGISEKLDSLASNPPVHSFMQRYDNERTVLTRPSI